MIRWQYSCPYCEARGIESGEDAPWRCPVCKRGPTRYVRIVPGPTKTPPVPGWIKWVVLAFSILLLLLVRYTLFT